MIAIAVDDEILMLGALVAAIKGSPDISEVYQFSGCDEALAFVSAPNIKGSSSTAIAFISLPPWEFLSEPWFLPLLYFQFPASRLPLLLIFRECYEFPRVFFRQVKRPC